MVDKKYEINLDLNFAQHLGIATAWNESRGLAR